MKGYTAIDACAIRSAIEGGDLRRAIQLHRAIFPSAELKMIRDTDEGDLQECLQTPLPVFSFCSDEELREVRLRMATAICLRISAERAFIPDSSLAWPHEMSPEAVAQNFFKAIATFRNVSSWCRSGVVKTVKIINSSDGPCDACLEAAHEYELAQLPGLPLHNCENLNTFGCRCVASICTLTEP